MIYFLYIRTEDNEKKSKRGEISICTTINCDENTNMNRIYDMQNNDLNSISQTTSIGNMQNFDYLNNPCVCDLSSEQCRCMANQAFTCNCSPNYPEPFCGCEDFQESPPNRIYTQYVPANSIPNIQIPVYPQNFNTIMYPLPPRNPVKIPKINKPPPTQNYYPVPPAPPIIPINIPSPAPSYYPPPPSIPINISPPAPIYYPPPSSIPIQIPKINVPAPVQNYRPVVTPPPQILIPVKVEIPQTQNIVKAPKPEPCECPVNFCKCPAQFSPKCMCENNEMKTCECFTGSNNGFTNSIPDRGSYDFSLMKILSQMIPANNLLSGLTQPQPEMQCILFFKKILKMTLIMLLYEL